MKPNNMPSSRLTIWLTAIRPFAYTGSTSAVAVGLALAAFSGHKVDWGLAALTLLGVLCFHTGANLLNDCFDHARGLDTEVLPTSGAVVRGWLTERQVHRAALGFLALGSLCGLALVGAAGLPVLWFGILGTFVAVGYTRRGLCLKYAGLGDVAIFLAFGVLPVCGTYWVQTQTFSWLPLLWSLPVVSFTVGILHANNWRDLGRDGEHGCRTVARRLGERGSAVYYASLVLGPYILVCLYALIALVSGTSHLAPPTVALVLLVLPLSLKLAKVRRDVDRDTFEMLDARTAQLQLAFGTLLTLAFIVGTRLSQGGGHV
ncbi:MAG: 1,4-dihydroxy-2-naphthoate octaprenyltransferase [Lentisphaerae bacterium]|jgi:1,4-dihydroxy-2-naphthoate polyprenyltransferase|nr:1,4-dihydroxy-2-naphthoate octaprenyltransferase [Lentisphaerota bacterium]MBT4818139.1 1,4-dihydroxy-2-naphthoate octaprenyltransferase [Lentisphaerota bacterium]MBT5606361.1 1,4-dihydroxy-2-naphthoate octaprenyltransferase [Lentisphaerota bacterium]MBT7056784.1 1,4-dihydroxy-2-naphthoate octaprenyltransferase [Lentisphaerota bacterium]MBT7840389.1 1,4-dihydroxy-2-naphthoate octaprenyltransferase [Lentisphaerota bacterium]